MPIRCTLTGPLAIAVLAAGITAAPAQQVRRTVMHEPEIEFRFPPEADAVSVPFELVNHHVILPVSVNGSEPMRIVLDTGMPSNGLTLFNTERTKALELEFGGMRAKVGGAGGSGQFLEAKVATGATIAVGEVEIQGAWIIVMPPVEHFASYHDGVVGAALFSNFAVRLDYDTMRMTLQLPDKFQPPRDAAEVPFELRMRVPHAEAVVTTSGGKVVPVELVVDLGASHPVSLNVDSSEELAVPSGALKTVIGKGVSGPVNGSVGRLRSLDVGGIKLPDVLATFPVREHQTVMGLDSRNGNLGNGFLSHFNVTFDYAGNRMFLERNSRTDEPFEWDMSGLRMREDLANPFAVDDVLPGSPAAEAGIRAGDVLTDLDGTPATDVGLHEIKQRFRRDGAKMLLGFRRGEERIEVRLTLRRLV